MKFINTLFDEVKNLDKKIKKIMNMGFVFSLLLALISSLLLLTYETVHTNPSLFYIGLSLFRTSLAFAIMFFICAIGFDSM